MHLTHLKELTIKNTIIDFDRGLFVVEFFGHKQLQCSLMVDPNKEGKYLRQISSTDNGYMDKKNKEVNQWNIINGEHKHIDEFLLHQATLVRVAVV